jgi:antimicrobial peptide system SdpA family protein
VRRYFVLGLGVGLVSIGSIWAAALFTALPTTVLDARSASGGRPVISTLIPQGWSFFTRDPQSPSLVIYDVGPGGQIIRAGTLPQTRPENLGGLSRNQRSQDTEKSLLARSVTEWSTCDGEGFEACASRVLALPADVVVSDATEPNFCGEYLLVLQAVTPFAFRHATSGEIQAEEMAHVDVECEVPS